MERWRGCVALVTGSASGIGAAVARMLVSHEVKVIGCDKVKTEEKGIIPYVCNLRNEKDVLEMFDTIKKEHGHLSVCACCAGVLHCSPLLTGSTGDWRDMWETNVLSTTICFREAYKHMSEIDKPGHLVVISSGASYRSSHLHYLHFYAATKHAIRSLVDSYRSELEGLTRKVRVSSVTPGVTKTAMSAGVWSKLREKYPDLQEDVFQDFKALDSEDVASAVEYALGAPQHVQVHDIRVNETDHYPSPE